MNRLASGILNAVAVAAALVVIFLATATIAQKPAAQETDSLQIAASHSLQKDAERGEQIIIGMGTEPATLLGPFASNDAEVNISSLVMPWLTNLEFRGELVHVPGLAERWERSADGTEIVYYLKTALWDDGKPITAEDVIFTWNLVAAKEFGASRIEYTKRIAKVEAVSEKVVKFTFKNAYFTDNQLSDANVGVLPKHVYNKITPENVKGNEGALVPVGHGPFRVLSHEGTRLFVLERNPNCVTARVPYLKRAVFYYTAAPDATKNALLTGDVDAMETTRPEDVAEIVEKGGFVTIPRGLRGVDFVTWNHKNPLFNDRDVRRALTLAVDRGGLNHTVFRTKTPGLYAEPIGTIPPVLERAVPKDLVVLPFDRKEAERILDERGWKRAAGGIREKDNKKFSFTLIVNAETPRRVQSARMVQQDLKEIGIEVKLDEMKWDALNKRMYARDFEAAVYGFSTSLQLKQGEVWHSTGPFNFCNYSNPKVDSLIDQMFAEEDLGKVRAELITLQKLIYEDQPVTFLSWYARVAVVREKYKDFSASILSFCGEINKCYVPKSLQKKFVNE